LELISLDEEATETPNRLESFMAGSQQDSFKSAKECMKKELAYEKKALFPQLLEKTQNTQLWAKLDRQFEVPAVYSAVRIETPPITSAKDQTLMMLLSQQLSDKFREELNEALNAGYALDLSVGRNGLNIQMYGFSGKIKEFFFKVVNCPCLNPNAKKQNHQSSFLQLTSDPDAMRFKRVKDSLNQALRNSFERKLYE
jgi:secreted Zn-dependent insulinase-like peptidase